MEKFWRSFLAAVGLLTVLPAGRPPTPQEMAGAVPFFPVVGCLLGLVLWGLDILLAGVPPLLRHALVVVALVVLTGALHLDGLADTCDGLAGTTPAQRLAIMADTRLGVFGLAGVVCILILKFAALASLAPPLRGPALIAAPLLGRWSMTLVMLVFPYARGPGGLGYCFKQGARLPSFLAATLFTAGVLAAAVPGSILVILPIVAPLACLLGCWMTRRLGGLTGDVYGAVCEVTEALVFVLFSASPWRA